MEDNDTAQKNTRKIEDQQEYTSLLQNTSKDRIYATAEANSFAFGEEVAIVFDDMISRSVPYYLDLQILTSSVASKFYKNDTAIYDLGCSTGTALALIAKRLPEASPLIGIDSSSAMREQAISKFKKLKVDERITLQDTDLLDVEFDTSSLFIANYTLQFLPIAERLRLLRKIASALTDKGVLLITEKTVPYQTSAFGDLVTTLHEDFKYQNGYSALEIAGKRESLKGVMQPVGEQKNQLMFKEAGFANCIELMRGYSFITWLVSK